MNRFFQSGIYLLAALSHLWLILMIAMSTAFGGVSQHSMSFIASFFGEIASVVLVAIGSAALLAARRIPTALLLSGPCVSCIMVIFLGIAAFRQSAGRSSFCLLKPSYPSQHFHWHRRLKASNSSRSNPWQP